MSTFRLKNVPSIATLALVILLSSACAGEADTPASGAENAMAEDVGASDAMSRPDAQNAAGVEEQTVPPNWSFRADRSDEEYVVGADSTADIFFVTMTPGWHVTSGPAGIYYHPASTAAGDFTAVTEIHLFNPGSRREGFGLLIGGKDLDGPEQAYTYFLIRQGGEYLIKERTGDETRVITNWTSHPAIMSHSGAESDTAKNKLSVRASGDEVEFLVNDQPVAALLRTDVMTDGIVGLRVNHGLNLHVSDLRVE